MAKNNGPNTRDNYIETNKFGPFEPSYKGYQFIGGSYCLQLTNYLRKMQQQSEVFHKLNLVDENYTIESLYYDVEERGKHELSKKVILLIGEKDVHDQLVETDIIRVYISKIIEHLIQNEVLEILIFTLPPCPRYATSPNFWKRLQIVNNYIKLAAKIYSQVRYVDLFKMVTIPKDKNILSYLVPDSNKSNYTIKSYFFNENSPNTSKIDLISLNQKGLAAIKKGLDGFLIWKESPEFATKSKPRDKIENTGPTNKTDSNQPEPNADINAITFSQLLSEYESVIEDNNEPTSINDIEEPEYNENVESDDDFSLLGGITINDETNIPKISISTNQEVQTLSPIKIALPSYPVRNKCEINYSINLEDFSDFKSVFDAEYDAYCTTYKPKNDDHSISSIVIDDDIEDEITAEKIPEDALYQSTPDTSPMFFVNYDLTKMKCLLDSGARVSAMKREIYDKIISENPDKKYSEISAPGTTLGNAMGARKNKVLKQVYFPMTINGVVVNHWFNIVEQLNFEIIVGYDWIKLYVTDIKIKEMKVLWEDENGSHSFPIFDLYEEIEREEFPNFAINVKETDEIAPNNTEENIDEKIINFTAKLTHIPDDSVQELKAVFLKYKDVFADRIGLCNIYTHKFNIIDNHKVFVKRTYPMIKSIEAKCDKVINVWMRDGVIEPSNSEYSSPLVIVKKSNGDVRPVGDYRDLNRMLRVRPDTTENIEHLLRKFNGKKYYSSIDFTSSFLQINLDPESRKYTAFLYKGRNLQFCRVPFGTADSMQAFIECLHRILANECSEFAVTYVDDILIISETLREHIEHIEILIKKIHSVGMTLNINKCKFILHEVKFLGHIISEIGIKPNEEKINCIRNFPIPKNKNECESFLGICNFYRRHIPNYATTSLILYDYCKRTENTKWSNDHFRCFDELRQKLSNAALIYHPDFSKKFYIATDASMLAIAGHIYQINENGDYCPVAFYSRVLKKHERPYTTTEIELLAILYICHKAKDILLGHDIEIFTDHDCISKIKNNALLTSKVLRWVLHLQMFNPVITHIKGKDNFVADTLSRHIPLQSVSEAEMQIHFGYMNVTIDPEFEQFLEDIPNYQKCDNELNTIISTLQNPSDGNNAHGSYDYLLIGDILHLRTAHNIVIVPPVILREKIIWYFHQYYNHVGINKLLTVIGRYFGWPNISRMTSKVLSQCDVCIKAKKCERNAGPLQPIIPSGPGELIAGDLFGPLPRSTGGVNSIFVLIDVFSKYLKLYPIKNANSVTLVQKLKDYMDTVGHFKAILTDNGPQFHSTTWNDFCERKKIAIKHTSVYTPQSNPTERVMLELGKHLRITCHLRHTAWFRYIKNIEAILNDIDHDSTKFSPYYLTFGTNVKHEIDKYVRQISNNERSYEEDLKTAYDNLIHAAELRKAKYDRSHANKLREFNIGDQVYIKTHHLSSGEKHRTKKLELLNDGPYVITEIVSPNCYRITNIKDGTEKQQNIRNLIKG